MQLGLIGYPLGHSFSAKHFAERFAKEGIDAAYRLYEIASAEDSEVIEQVQRLDGFNVTSPYKEAIIPYLDGLDETARAVGAVNVVKRDGERWIGYNTDCVGFKEDLLLFEHLMTDGRAVRTDRTPMGAMAAKSVVRALVLGTGGAAKAVAYALRQLGVPYIVVSRTPAEKVFEGAMAVGYESLNKEMMEEYKLIINCTPLGMGAHKEECPPIPYQWIGDGHWLYDCIYNPAETVFLRRGRTQGARTRNGLGMLIQQAEAAWRIWKTSLMIHPVSPYEGREKETHPGPPYKGREKETHPGPPYKGRE